MKIIREEYSIRLIPDGATDDPEEVLFNKALNDDNLYWETINNKLYLVDCSNMTYYAAGDCNADNAIDALLSNIPVTCHIANNPIYFERSGGR